MATTAAKKTVTTSVSVPVKDSSWTELKAAKEFVGAPDSATVGVNNSGTPYPQPNADGTPNDSEYFPFNVTFSWSEDK